MIYGTFYDGQSSGSQSCGLWIDSDDNVHLDGTDFKPCHVTELSIPSRVGNAARLIGLPDNASFETASNDAVDRLAAKYKKPRFSFNAHLFESNFALVVVLAVFCTGLIFSGIRFGVPLAAEKIAPHIPLSVANALADKSLAELDSRFFSESTLGSERKRELTELFTTYLPKSNKHHFKLLFRSGDNFGANALALPNGTVILTDEFVSLADNDKEILSVMLHEVGHVVHLHSMRSLVEVAGIYAIYSWITGDVEVSSALILSLSAAALQAHYSRGHEWEADSYSLQVMLENEIDPIHFSRMMNKLEHYHTHDKFHAEEQENTTQENEEDVAAHSDHDDPSNNAGTVKDDEASEELKTAEVEDNEEAEDAKKEVNKKLLRYFSTHPPSDERAARFAEASKVFNKQ